MAIQPKAQETRPLKAVQVDLGKIPTEIAITFQHTTFKSKASQIFDECNYTRFCLCKV